MTALILNERPAGEQPDGLLILHHGRGAEERNLLILADALDPGHRLHVVAPRAPLSVHGSPGYHWYLVPRVGHPDRDSFRAAYAQLAALYEELWQRTGIGPERTVLGGFSMGAVVSYALGLGAGRPAPAGILAFSGFLPTVKDWHADLATRPELRAFIAHGRRDPTIKVDFARAAARRLRDGGLQVDYHESDVAHQIDPAHIAPAGAWLRTTLPRGAGIDS